VPLSVDPAVQNRFSFYPSPASDRLYLSNIAAGAKITVSNLMGQKVKTMTTQNVSDILNISDLQSGVYLLTYTDKQGNTTSSKFVKK